MINQFSRTELILGKEAVDKLKKSHVAVFGVGGVGGHIALSLARCGIGKLTIVDNDEISVTNINRQAVAFHSTIGKKKVNVLKNMLEDINPDIEVFAADSYFDRRTETEFDFSSFDYVADAIDSVTSKIRIIEICTEKNIPVISSMGTGNKLHPEMFKISDISKTSVCPLAKVMRRELRKRGIEHLEVLWSDEPPLLHLEENEEETEKRIVPGSVAFCPSVAGLMISGKIVRDITALTEINPFLQKDNKNYV